MPSLSVTKLTTMVTDLLCFFQREGITCSMSKGFTTITCYHSSILPHSILCGSATTERLRETGRADDRRQGTENVSYMVLACCPFMNALTTAGPLINLKKGYLHESFMPVFCNGRNFDYILHIHPSRQYHLWSYISSANIHIAENIEGREHWELSWNDMCRKKFHSQCRYSWPVENNSIRTDLFLGLLLAGYKRVNVDQKDKMFCSSF